MSHYNDHVSRLAAIHRSRATRAHMRALSAQTSEAARMCYAMLPLEHGDASRYFTSSAMRPLTVDERCVHALSLLDGDVPLSPALEAALWRLVLKKSSSEFVLSHCGVRVTRLDVALYAYFIFSCAFPLPEDLRMCPVTVATEDLPVGQQYWVEQMQLAAPASVFRDLPFDAELSDVRLMYHQRGASTATQRHPQYDAGLPSADVTAKVAYSAALKGVVSFDLPVAPLCADTGRPLWKSTTFVSVEVVRLLPPDVGTSIDRAFRSPNDAAMVLAQLAQFANIRGRGQLSVALCQLAICRWRSCSKAWVALHDALRALNAAVLLPVLGNDLFNAADCYLEALRLESSSQPDSSVVAADSADRLNLGHIAGPAGTETALEVALRAAFFASLTIGALLVVRRLSDV